jgi:acetyltransferase-like isoleucine patch superfamily enzyme
LRARHSIWFVLVNLFWDGFEWLISDIPGSLGSYIRLKYWRLRLHHIGRNVRIGVGVRIYAPKWVSIGDNCYIDDYVVIAAGPLKEMGQLIYHKPNNHFHFEAGSIVIGSRVHIAQYVLLQGHGGLHIGNDLTVAAGARIFSLSHHYRDMTSQCDPGIVWKFSSLSPPQEQSLIESPTVLKDNCAVGLNSVVLPGSTIGENSWLAALSLWRGDLPPNVIAAGNPAQIIKNRFE